jgi:hypothetical protein
MIAGVPTIPNGVFALIKAGAPTGSSVLSNPDADGISLREGWDAVNPAEDVYDWSYFDAEITKAQNAGKKVLIHVSVYAFTHKKLDVVRTILEDPAVEAPAEQIHEVLNNKKVVHDF